MKMINASTGKYPDKFILVDDDDYELMIKLGKWTVDKKKNGVFYAYMKIEGKKVYAHRLVMSSPPEIVDHIDGDGLNCQKCNLRACSNQQNSWNKRKSRNKTSSKYKGVYPTDSGKYRARIWFGDRSMGLGCFITQEEAARAYNEAAKSIFGEYCKPNQIPIMF